MNDMLEKVKNADSKIQLVVLAIVVLLVIIIGFSSFGNKGNNEDISLETNESKENVVDDEISDDNTETLNDVTESVTNFPQFTRIKIATLAGPVHEGVVTGKKRSCDTVVMINREIPATSAPLNGSLKELFNFSGDLDFVPGNFIKTQNNLTFSEARIDNRIAKIYLNGEIGPLAGDCDSDRMKIQVEETALQFNTVSEVEIYLNGEKI